MKEKLFKVFVGRQDMYGKQCQKGNKWIFMPIREPISDKVIKNHLDGKHTIGSYFPVGTKTRYMVIDIDVKDKTYLFSLLKRCKYFELPYAIEGSGQKGYHIWFFFDDIEKHLVRKLGIYLAPDSEVFPKQDMNSVEKPGNLIKLPLGIHRAVGKRCLFLKESLEPIKDQWSYIDNFDKNKISREHLCGVLDLISPKVSSKFNGHSCSLRLFSGYEKPLRSCMIKIMEVGVKQGERNITCHALANELLYRGYNYESARELLFFFNEKCNPPMQLKEVFGILDKVYGGHVYYYACFHPALRKFCSGLN